MPSGDSPNSKATQFKALVVPLELRFHESYIPEPNSGCWLWLANLDNKGYGRITVPNLGFVGAHRVSWEIANKRKTKKFILHKCDNPACVNPDHLYAGTQRDNIRDRTQRNRWRPDRGMAHANAKLTDENILAIRNDLRSQRKIALDYKISQAAVSLIKTRRRWTHV